MREEGQSLENQGNLAVLRCNQHFARTRRRLSGDGDVSVGRRFKPRDQPQQRGLATPRMADDGEAFAPVQGEAHACERVGAVKCSTEIGDTEDLFLHSVPRLMIHLRERTIAANPISSERERDDSQEQDLTGRNFRVLAAPHEVDDRRREQGTARRRDEQCRTELGGAEAHRSRATPPRVPAPRSGARRQ